MGCKRLKEEVVKLTCEEWNDKKREILSKGIIIKRISNANQKTKGRLFAYEMVEDVNVSISVNEGGMGPKSTHIVKYMTRKDNQIDRIVTNNVPDEFRRFVQYYSDFPRDMPQPDGFSIAPILWYNPCFEDRDIEAVSYDINSAFLYSLTQDLPVNVSDCRQIIDAPLREGNIGLSFTQKIVDTPGKNCRYQWEKGRPEGIQRYAHKLYEEKLKATTPEEKHKAKSGPNVVMGQLTNRCWPMRYIIVAQCNKRMEQLLLKLKWHTPEQSPVLYVNTDSIVIKKSFEQKFLKILAESGLDVNSVGNGLGQFKNDKRGIIRYRGFNNDWWDYDGNWIAHTQRGLHKEDLRYQYNIKTGYLEPIINLFDLI